MKFAPQVPVSYDDGSGIISGVYCNGDNCQEKLEQKPPLTALFDNPTAATLSQRVPLALLTKAAQSGLLPENLRQALLVSTWSRAAILGDSAGALELGHRLGQELPSAAKYLSEYDAAKDDGSREFAAVFAMLHFPGMRPYVNAGFSARRRSPRSTTSVTTGGARTSAGISAFGILGTAAVRGPRGARAMARRHNLNRR